MTPETLGFGAALTLGLAFGAGPCNLSCLPFLGPLYLAAGKGPRADWRILLPFTLGRLSGYALLGLAAGGLGMLIHQWIDPAQARQALGAATLGMGLWLLFKPKGRDGTAAVNAQVKIKFDQILSEPTANRPAPARPETETLPSTGLFAMGLGMALNPCLPLQTILFAAAASGAAWAGLQLGLGFGLGAVAVPTLVFGLGVAHFGAQLREHLAMRRQTLENVSALLLLFLGVGTLTGWITP